MSEPHDTRQLAIGFELFRVRFMDELAHEVVEEFLPLVASFVPGPQRTARESGAAAWQAYVETESGALHACYLEHLVRDPGTIIKLEDAAAIVRPWLDPERTNPMYTSNRIAHHWFYLREIDGGAWEELRVFIAASKTSPIFWEAVKLIAERLLMIKHPLGDDLLLWYGDMQSGKTKKPLGKGGRPKNTSRNMHIFAALLVLQQLGLSVTLDAGKDRSPSGCGVVADILHLSYDAVATVWTDARSKLYALSHTTTNHPPTSPPPIAAMNARAGAPAATPADARSASSCGSAQRCA